MLKRCSADQASEAVTDEGDAAEFELGILLLQRVKVVKDLIGEDLAHGRQVSRLRLVLIVHTAEHLAVRHGDLDDVAELLELLRVTAEPMLEDKQVTALVGARLLDVILYVHGRRTDAPPLKNQRHVCVKRLLRYAFALQLVVFNAHQLRLSIDLPVKGLLLPPG